MIVLTLNNGSSSLKFGLYQIEGPLAEHLLTGEIEDGELRAWDALGIPLSKIPIGETSAVANIRAIGHLLKSGNLPAPRAIGHRVVHGGPKLLSHCLIDEDVIRKLEEARALSPLHASAALALIELAGNAWPDIPQVACFDTAFHVGMPATARTLPVAKTLRDAGLHRYGFHGLSCESVLHQLADTMPTRIIIAHLGSGASITAVRDGRSVDTSMGLTPSGGVMMATRSGDLDPGAVIYLLREKAFDAEMLEQLIDHQSGLFGVSSLSGDLRILHKARLKNPDASLAIDMFCISVAKQIAGMMTTLGGADMIVFTGGIGENDAVVRNQICDQLTWAGICLDGNANQAGVGQIHAASSRSLVCILPSQEDLQIGLHVFACISQSSDTSP